MVRRADPAAAAAADPAHALRAPLHNLLVWTDVLEHHLGGAPEPVARALAGIRQAVQQQARLIDALEGRR